MDHRARGSALDSPARREAARPAAGRPPRADKADPRSRLVNRSARAHEFAAFADDVRRDLAPRGVLEGLMADHVAASAWRLLGAIGRQAARDLDGRDDPDRPSEAPRRVAPSAADCAARSVREAVESFEVVRGVRHGDEPGGPAIAPNEWPIVPFEAPEPAVDVSRWRDRLVYDFDVSDVSPVVKGTWITVGHVVTQVVDGQSWADILRSHPELTEDDIRLCVAFAVAQDQDPD